MPRQRKRNHQRGGGASGGIRPFWSGTITFGLVSVPVDLFPASRKVGASFRMLDRGGTPLSRRYKCPAHNHPVHPEHIVRGYPVGDDEYIIVRDEELRSLQPRKSRDIDLRQFVDRSEVPPILFERAYYLTPAGDSTKAYRLLAEVMQQTGHAGIATFVMRDKEYLVVILAEAGVLRAETLRFSDEIRSPHNIGLPEPSKVSSSLVSKFRKAIRNQQSESLNESDLEDEADQQLRELVKRKLQRGEDVVDTREETDMEEEEQDADEAPTVDLIETIRRSLRQRDGAADNGKTTKRKDAKKTPFSKGRAASRSAAESDGLASKTKEELYQQAQALQIPGRSGMSKEQLLRAIDRADK